MLYRQTSELHDAKSGGLLVFGHYKDTGGHGFSIPVIRFTEDETPACPVQTFSFFRQTISEYTEKEMKKRILETFPISLLGCGGPTRTGDLQVMSLASYQLLHSAMLYFLCNRFYFPFAIAKLRTIAGVCKHSCCFFAFFLSFPCNNDTYSLQTQGKSTVSACIFAFHELRCRRPISPYFYGRFERAAAADNGKVRDKR